MTFTLLLPELAQRFAGTLLQFIWQGAVIALVTAMVLRMMRRHSAESRYAVGIAGLALMLVAPVMTFAFYEQAGAVAVMLLRASSLVSGSAIATALPSDARAWTEGILLAWCTGVCALLARVATGWYLSHRLVCSADGVIPAGLQQLFEAVKERLALTRAVKLLIHARIDSPIVVGWLRPVVLLPLSALTSLSEEHLVAVFAHELAHIRRHDFVVNMLQRCVEAILFYHPAVWWLSNRVRRERENCCDDLAVRVCGNRKRYAEALLRLERERGAVPVVAVAATGSGTLERVRRILGLEPSEADWRAAVVAPLIVIVWLSTGFLQPPTVQAREIAPVPPRLSVEPSVLEGGVRAAAIADQPAAPRSTPLRALAAIIAPPAPVTEPVPAAVPAEPQTPSPTAGAQPASSPKPGKMQGTVVDAAGKPVSGADIRLTPLNPGMQPNGAAYTAVSDENGAFVLENIAPHPRLGLSARKTGYQLFRHGSASQAAPTVPIPLAEGESLPGLVLVMEQEGVLSGRVVRAEGGPMADADIIVTNTTAARTLPITGTTNERGEFRIAGLNPGRYHLAAMILEGAAVMTTYYPGVTDRAAATAIEVAQGQQTTGIEFRIQKVKGYMLRGSFPGSATGTVVYMATPKGVSPAAAMNGAVMAPNPLRGDSSAFELGPLAPGEYLVQAMALVATKAAVVGSAVVTIVNADVDGVTLTPIRTYTVTGRAALEDGTVEQLLGSRPPGAAGRGGRGAATNAGPALTLTPLNSGGAATPVQATIGPDGTFKFEDVQPGLYTLGSPSFMATYLKTLMWDGMDVTSSQLKIESGGEMTLTYRRGAVRVTGTATGADGKPVPGATALIWPVEFRPNRASGGARASAIDATGAFSMTAIQPGLYYVAAFPGINGVTALVPRFHQQFNDRATVLEIKENTPVTLDIQAVTGELVNEALKKPQ